MAKRALYSLFMRFVVHFFLCIFFFFPSANVTGQKLAADLGSRIKIDLEEGHMEMRLDGKPFVRGNLKNGQPIGKWERYHPNGSKAAKVNYGKGVKDGSWHFYHSNGNLKANLEFENGKKVGVWKSFWPSGASQLEIHHREKTASLIRYFEKSGTQKSFLALEEDRRVGADTIEFQRKFFSQNRPYSFEKKVNGKPDSVWIRFHESSSVWEKLLYEKGKLKSVLLMQDPLHNPLDYGDFVEGSGLLKRYRPSGSLFSEIQYKNGERHGRAWYYRNGKIAANGSFRNNLKVGTWKFYNQAGTLHYEIDFYDAKNQWAYVTVYGNSGFEREESEYWKGLRHGLARTYSFLNELENEKHYAFGYLHGTYLEFLKGGKERTQGAYAFGMKVGDWKYFNPSGRTTFEERFVRNPSIDTSSIQFYDMNDIERIPMMSSVIWSTLKNPKDRALLRFDALINKHPAYTFEPEVTYTQFAGGQTAADEYAQYLEEAKAELSSDVKGEAVLRRVVDEFGFPYFSKMELGLGFGYDQAILESAKTPLIYLPAELHGLPSVGTYRHRIDID